MARGGKREGAGRPKGSLDKGNADLRQMILQALENKGGVEYLEQQAVSNPSGFMSLLGKVLPKEVTGADGKELFPSRIEIVGVVPE
jgi:ribosomal protein S19E (S16A)